MWKDVFYFTKRERRGLVVLIAILLVLIAINTYLSNLDCENKEIAVLDESFHKKIDSLKQKQAVQKTVYKKNKKETSAVKSVPKVSSALKSIEINTADSLQLLSVPGIGNVYAKRIVAYRNKLGGFHSVEQLREIYGMTDENYKRIVPHILVDSDKIEKINLNTAGYEQLKSHPYLTAKQAYILVKNRKKKKPWMSWDEIPTDENLTKNCLERIKPYFCLSNP